jgi:hypothetical protein
VTLLLSLLCPPAFAQEPPDDDVGDEEREAFHARLHMMRMYALTEALELDEATAAKLFPYLREGEEAMGRVHREIRLHRQALRALADQEAPSEKEINEHIGAIGTLEQTMVAMRTEQIAGLQGILTASQRLRFVLTHARIDRELRNAIRERRGRGDDRDDRGDRRRGGWDDGERGRP